MQNLIAVFALIMLLMGIGRVLTWRRIVPERSADTLNLVVLYVNLPAAVLLYASRLKPGLALLGTLAVPWLLLAFSVGAVLLLARLFAWSRAVTGVLLLTVPLGNTSYLGYPLTRALLGPQALPYAVVYDQFGTFVILSTYGVAVLALYAHGVRPRPWAIVRRIVTFPPFLALLAALTVVPAALPAAVAGALTTLAAPMLPLVALAIGMQLRLRPDRAHRGALGAGLGLKLLVLPALTLLLAPLLGLHGDARAAAVLESGMAPMVTAGALAAMAGMAPELAAAMVGYGVVLLLATLPLWLWLLR
jgi:predicted permease